MVIEQLRLVLRCTVATGWMYFLVLLEGATSVHDLFEDEDGAFLETQFAVMLVMGMV